MHPRKVSALPCQAADRGLGQDQEVRGTRGPPKCVFVKATFTKELAEPLREWGIDPLSFI